MGVPQNGWFTMENPIKWMIYGYNETVRLNRLRIFQPTLGFFSAIGEKYGNYERGYPQVALI